MEIDLRKARDLANLTLDINAKGGGKSEKPTIHELETLLDDEGTDNVSILPNGEVRALGKVHTHNLEAAPELSRLVNDLIDRVRESPQSEDNGWKNYNTSKPAHHQNVWVSLENGRDAIFPTEYYEPEAHWGNGNSCIKAKPEHYWKELLIPEPPNPNELGNTSHS